MTTEELKQMFSTLSKRLDETEIGADKSEVDAAKASINALLVEVERVENKETDRAENDPEKPKE